MPRTPPDHRAQRVLSAIQSGGEFRSDDADERHLYLTLTAKEAPSPDVEEAVLMWLNEESRHVFNALLLAKASDDQICAGLDTSVTALAPYKRLFFDRGVFRNALDVIGYVKNLDVADEVRAHYRTAIEQGPEFLINKFRVGARPSVDPRMAIQLVLNDSTDRFVSHRGQKIDSALAKEAMRWGAQALQAAAMSIDKGSDQSANALSELRVIMLKMQDRTETPEQAGIDPTDVV